MAITKQLTPDPIVTASVEIRFEFQNNTSQTDQRMGNIICALTPILPRFITSNFPDSFRDKSGPFEHFPAFYLSNDDFSVGVGPRSILFEVNGEYPGWKQYLPFIEDVLYKIVDSIQEAKVTRCGVRYASIFPDFLKMSDALVFRIEPNLPGYYQKNDFVRTTFQLMDGTQLLLQIGENVQTHQKGRGDRTGLYLDIDASREENLPTWGQELNSLIDLLHAHEKQLFESLMRPEVLQQFHPAL